jgi:hypothetical protein
MYTARRSADRGMTDFGWPRSWHTFSFGDYHALPIRALALTRSNEDRVAPGRGLGTPQHRDTENATLAKAKANGVKILSNRVDNPDRSSVIVQLPGGYIAEVHQPRSQ